MNDDGLGNRLRALRKRKNLSQTELGRMVGVSGRMISKWENGAAKPGPEAARQVALALNAATAELFGPEASSPTITKIVITGGPCAGKTTAMSWIQNAFTEKGYSVLFVPETATELIANGAAPWLCSSARDFQACLVKLQLDKETAFIKAADLMKTEKVLIVCDRGVLDNKAYMSELDFQYVMSKLATDEVEMRDHYDAVFHLTTAAKGAREYYTLANNAARTETIEQASVLDDKLLAAWTGHPHLRVIDNTTDFEHKMLRLLSEISSFLGEPEPLEIERKFLIEYPPLKRLEKMLNCQKIDIIQTYLRTADPEVETRIRQRGTDGHYIFFKTNKRKIGQGKRIEVESRLSQSEYLRLMMEADPRKRQIRKTRYCLSANGLYYEIDVYPFWNDQAILEIELHDESQRIVIPEFLKVIREVTNDEQYMNSSLAANAPQE